MKGRLLVIEDRASLGRMLERALTGEGYAVELETDGSRAVARLGEDRFDLVLTDLKLPGAGGLEVVAACRAVTPPMPVIVMTAYGTVEVAVEAMKRGALDFLEKPVEIDDLFRRVAGAVGTGEPDAVFAPPGAPPIVGRHPKLLAALHLLEKVAPLDSTVLLTGESGTGKEVFARALHALSPRRAGPFVAINCAALPEALLENELFGHERGAYTGAGARQAGRFELAAGGTLFLDEIGELGMGVQAKILRVLELRTFERVGGGATLTADVRLVAATNRNLSEHVAAGRFRQDLFYRLEVFPIELPPLRERGDDIVLLTDHLLAEISARLGKQPVRAAMDAHARLKAEPWPGNVRQLANLLERAIILADGSELGSRDLDRLLTPGTGDERERIREALIASGGDKKQVAEALGWSQRNLQRKIREHDLEGVPKYRNG